MCWRPARDEQLRQGRKHVIAPELARHRQRKGIEGVYNRKQELGLRARGFAACEAFLSRIALAANVDHLLSEPRNTKL